jgi:hypothetical protein
VVGIAFAILSVDGGFVQGDVPGYTDGSAAITTWFAEHGGRYLVGYCLVALGLRGCLVYLATLVRVLMLSAGEGGRQGVQPRAEAQLAQQLLGPLAGGASADAGQVESHLDIWDGSAR